MVQAYLAGQKRLSGFEGTGDALFEAVVYTQGGKELVLERMQRFRRKCSNSDFLLLGVCVSKGCFPIEPDAPPLKRNDIRLAFVRCFDAPQDSWALHAVTPKLRNKGQGKRKGQQSRSIALPKEAVLDSVVRLRTWIACVTVS